MILGFSKVRFRLIQPVDEGCLKLEDVIAIDITVKHLLFSPSTIIKQVLGYHSAKGYANNYWHNHLCLGALYSQLSSDTTCTPKIPLKRIKERPMSFTYQTQDTKMV